MHPDETHESTRKNRPPAFAEFMDTVHRQMPADAKANLPTGIGDYINGLVSYALKNLEKFEHDLRKAIYGVYVQSPGGERFILDPVKTKPGAEAMLFVDAENNIISVLNPILGRIKDDKEESILVLKDYQSYEILTGQKTGQKFDKYTRPIPTEIAIE